MVSAFKGCLVLSLLPPSNIHFVVILSGHRSVIRTRSDRMAEMQWVGHTLRRATIPTLTMPCSRTHSLRWPTSRLPEKHLVENSRGGVRARRKLLGWTFSNFNKTRTMVVNLPSQQQQRTFLDACVPFKIWNGFRSSLQYVKPCNVPYPNPLSSCDVFIG